MARGRGDTLLWVRGLAVKGARCARVPLRFAKGGEWRALLFSGFPRPRE